MSVLGPPKGAPIGLIAGSSRTFRFQIEHNKSRNITGFEVWMNVGRTSVDGRQIGEVLLQKHSSKPTEVTIVDALKGLVDVFFVPADTLDMGEEEAPIGTCGSSYRYDLWIGVGGKPYACLTPGDFVVTAGVGPGLIH